MSTPSKLRDQIVNGLSFSQFKQSCDDFSEHHPHVKFNYERDIPSKLEYGMAVHETLRQLQRLNQFTAFENFLYAQWPHLRDKSGATGRIELPIPTPNPAWVWPGLTAVLLLALLFVLWSQSTAGYPPVTPPPTATFTATQEAILATATQLALVLPTQPVPTLTERATFTPAPPTATPAASLPTLTHTPVPPTNTFTPTPTFTYTPVPPTLTFTPTATKPPTPTNTFTPTATKPPTPTNTFTPTATKPPTPTFTSTTTSTLEAGAQQAFVLPNGEVVTMVFIPAGPFMMGNNNGEDDEKPEREIPVDSFWLDLTEVTNEQFAWFVAATGYVTTSEENNNDYTWQTPFGPSSSIEGKEQEPVIQVSWVDADAFCEWRGAELPSEQQWEKAARWNPTTQESYLYPWGNEFKGENVNFCDENCPFNWADKTVNDGYELLAPVGSYSPEGDSPYGLQDMAGNVWEWTSSYYTDSYADNAEVYNDRYVLRGGSWDYDGENLRSSDRNWGNSGNRNDDFGFRCSSALN